MVDWKEIAANKSREQARLREQEDRAARHKAMFVDGLPAFADSLFTRVTEEIDGQYNSNVADAATKVRFSRSGQYTLTCLRTRPQTANMVLSFVPDGERATFGVKVLGTGIDGKPSSSDKSYLVWCNPDGVFVWQESIRGSIPTISTDDVVADFMKTFAWYLA